MLAIANVDPIVPVYTARLRNGIIVVVIVKPPAKTPEAPSPATTRPAIRPREEGANAHTKLPTSNMNKYIRYDSFFGNSVYALPASG